MSTYVPIQAITLTSNTTSIEFTGIPQTFTDLVIVCSVRDTASGTQTYPWIRFNGDSATNYSFTRVHGNGTSAASGRASNQNKLEFCEAPGAGSTANYFAPLIVQVMNYANTTTNKTTLVRTNNVGGAVQAGALACLYRSTSAVTSILINGQTALASGSTFTLYGVGSGSPKAFGGDEVRTDGTYWYHIYNSSGRFEPVQALTCDYLVIAGGGGGGSGRGGGGGAGGYRTTVGTSGGGGSAESALTLSANTSYTVTIGAGGAGGVNDGNGVAGSNSVFSTVTSTGGGFGGGYQKNGGNGGSGGGAAGVGGGASTTPGTGTTNEGFGGGQDSTTGGGGGGGAGAVGGNAGANGGTGGTSLSSSISGSSVARAGGGGGGNSGGSGGTGGGGGAGNGSSTNVGGSATANTGSGGGGCDGNPSTAGNGGSGIVIVRYAV